MTEWACNIAQAIARVLEARSISDRELARRIGRSQNYVSIRMRCESPLSLADLDAIGDALDLDPASLLAGVPRRRLSDAGSNVTPIRMPSTDDAIDHVEAPDLGSQPFAAKRGTRKIDQQDHAD